MLLVGLNKCRDCFDGQSKVHALGVSSHIGVDANEFASSIEESSTGVARIQRGICLDFANLRIEIADDALGNGRRDDATGVTDRISSLASLSCIDGGKVDGGELAVGLDLEQCQVGAVGAPYGDEFGVVFFACAELNLNLGSILDDMGIGEDQAIRFEDDATTTAFIRFNVDHGRIGFVIDLLGGVFLNSSLGSLAKAVAWCASNYLADDGGANTGLEDQEGGAAEASEAGLFA